MPTPLIVSGFVIVYDVSIPPESVNNTKQMNFLSNALSKIFRMKIPAVIVATKCDCLVPKSINQLYKWLNQQKIHITVIEASAQYNVNIDNIIMYFLSLPLESTQVHSYSSTMSKVKIKFKNTSYADALRKNNDQINEATNNYVRLIRSSVHSYKTEFLRFLMDFTPDNLTIYEKYTRFCGTNAASTLFNLHVAYLRRHVEDRLLNSHLSRLENALDYFLPDISIVESNTWQWEKSRDYILNNSYFNLYFCKQPDLWNSDQELENFVRSQDSDQISNSLNQLDIPNHQDSNSNSCKSYLIPVSILHSEGAKFLYEKHVKKLLQTSKNTLICKQLYNLISKMAAENKLLPGSNWNDFLKLLAPTTNNEYFFSQLSESHKLECFNKVLSNALKTAREQFIELLLENNLFIYEHMVCSNKIGSTIDMNLLFDRISSDFRFYILDKVSYHRQTLFLNHIAIFNDPDLCSLPVNKCTERMLATFLESCNIGENRFDDQNEEGMMLMVIGSKDDCYKIENIIQKNISSTVFSEYIYNGIIYSINIQHIGLDSINSTKTESIESIVQKTIHSNSASLTALVVVISSQDNLSVLEENLNSVRKLLDDQKIPLVFLFTKELSSPLINSNNSNKPIQFIIDQNESTELACKNYEKFQNDFMKMFERFPNINVFDYPIFQSHYEETVMVTDIHRLQIEDALRFVINFRTSSVKSSNKSSSEAPIIRILVCSMCGDDISIEFLFSLLTKGDYIKARQKIESNNILDGHFYADFKASHQESFSNDPPMLNIQSDFVDSLNSSNMDCKEFIVAVTFTSYHRAFNLVNAQSYHGIVMNCIVSRKAAVEVTKSFLSVLPPVPVYLYALDGYSSSVSVVNQTMFISTECSYDLFDDYLAKEDNDKQGQNIGNFYKMVAQSRDNTEQYFGEQLSFLGCNKQNSTLNDYTYSSGLSQTNSRNNSLVGNQSNGGESMNFNSKLSPIIIDEPPNLPTINDSCSVNFSGMTLLRKNGSKKYKTPFDKLHMARPSSLILANEFLSTCDLREPDSFTLPKKNGMFAKSASNFALNDIHTLAPGTINKENLVNSVPTTPSTPHRYRNTSTTSITKENRMSTIIIDKLKRRFISPPNWVKTIEGSSIWKIDGDKYIINCSISQYETNSPNSLLKSKKFNCASVPNILELDNDSMKSPKSHFASRKSRTAEINHLESINKKEHNKLNRTRLDLKKIMSFKKILPFNAKDNTTNKDKIYDKEIIEESEVVGQHKQHSSNNSSNSTRISKKSKFRTFSKSIDRTCSPLEDLNNDSKGRFSNSEAYEGLSRVDEKSSIANETSESQVASNSSKCATPTSKTNSSSDNHHKSRVWKTIKLKFGISKTHSGKIINNEPNSYSQSVQIKNECLKTTATPTVTGANSSSYQQQIEKWQKSKNKRFFEDVNRPNAYFGRNIMDIVETNVRSVSELRAINNSTMMSSRQHDEQLLNYFNEINNETINIDEIQTNLNKRQTLNVPILLRLCAEYIETNGLEIEGIYRINGNKHDLDLCISNFESNQNINFGTLGMSIHVFTGLLKLFFSLLPEPLIPMDYLEQISNAVVDPDATRRIQLIKDVVCKLPVVNLHTFEFLLHHLSIVSSRSSVNKMNSNCLATCFWPTLIRPNIGTLSGLSNCSMYANVFLSTCIEKVNIIFND